MGAPGRGAITPHPPPPVLVLEHDVAIRRFVAAVLRLAGHDVIETERAWEALLVLQERPVGAFVCDHRPPDIDGEELVGQLRSRADTARVPIVLLLSEPTLDLRVGAFEAGADCYVLKPIEGEILV